MEEIIGAFFLRISLFIQHSGVETQEEWIDARIRELTGIPDVILKRKCGFLAPLIKLFRQIRGHAQNRLNIGGKLMIEPKFLIDFVDGKKCFDVGCDAGCWTKVLTELGGNVTYMDVSPHALKYVKLLMKNLSMLTQLQMISVMLLAILICSTHFALG